MNLLVFGQKDDGFHFLLEQATHSEEGSGSSAWWPRLKSRIVTGYRHLRQHFAYQEQLLGRLRHAQELRMYHAPGTDPRDIETAFREILRRGFRKHTLWFAIDAALACLGGILAPLPGPNVFFFYPAIRALGHYLARQGSRHAQNVPLNLEVEALLGIVDGLELARLEEFKEQLEILERRYSMDPLEELLKSEVYGR